MGGLRPDTPARQMSTLSLCRIRLILSSVTQISRGCPTGLTSVLHTVRHDIISLLHRADSLQGYVDGIDDPGMGWARYAQTIRIFVLNSGLFYIQPSERTARAARAGWAWSMAKPFHRSA